VGRQKKEGRRSEPPQPFRASPSGYPPPWRHGLFQRYIRSLGRSTEIGIGPPSLAVAATGPRAGEYLATHPTVRNVLPLGVGEGRWRDNPSGARPQTSDSKGDVAEAGGNRTQSRVQLQPTPAVSIQARQRVSGCPRGWSRLIRTELRDRTGTEALTTWRLRSGHVQSN